MFSPVDVPCARRLPLGALLRRLPRLSCFSRAAWAVYWAWPANFGPGSVFHNIEYQGKNVRTYPYFGGIFQVMDWYERIPEVITDALDIFDGATWGAPCPRIGLLGGGFIFVTSPENVRHVLKDNFSNYVKGPKFRGALHDFLGDGIFAAGRGMSSTARRGRAAARAPPPPPPPSARRAAPRRALDAPRLARDRDARAQVASHMFSNRPLRGAKVGTFPLLERSLSDRRERQGRRALHRTAARRARCEGAAASVDIQDMYFRLTMDIFTFIAFGVDLDSLEREEARARARGAVAFATLSSPRARSRARSLAPNAEARALSPLLAPSRTDARVRARSTRCRARARSASEPALPAVQVAALTRSSARSRAASR